MKKSIPPLALPYRFELSTRPEKSIGTDEDWEVATAGLKDALDDMGTAVTASTKATALSMDRKSISTSKMRLDRSWQCGTIQLDMALPEKFELEYMDNDGQLKRPVMLHRAIFGSIERFFGILIEHFVGKFPLWISPLQVRVITVADRHQRIRP